MASIVGSLWVTASTTATTAVAASHSTTSGNAIAVFVSVEGAATPATITSVTDSKGNTYTPAVNLTHSAGEPNGAWFYCLSHAGDAALVVTANFSGTVATQQITCYEVNGVGSSDGTQSGQGNSSTFSTPSFTTTGSGIVFQGVAGYQATAGVTAGGTPTFTRDAASEQTTCFAQHLISGSGQSITPGASWSAATDRWVMVAMALKDGAGGGPAITSTSSATPANGSTMTITGTAFGASQGVGSVTIGGVTQAVTSWADTSIDVTVTRGTNQYGVTFNVVVTDNSAVASNNYPITSIQPQSGWSFVNLSTLVSRPFRLSATPDIASGDQLAYDNVGGLVVVAADGSYSTAASVYSFQFEAWNSGSGWGTLATQQMYEARPLANGLDFARIVSRGMALTPYRFEPKNWGSTPLAVEKWFAQEATGSATSQVTATTSLSAAVQAALAATASIGAAVQEARTATASVGAAVQTANTAGASVGAAVQASGSGSSSLGAAIQQALSAAATVDAAVQAAQTALAALDTYVQTGSSIAATLDAAVQAPRTATASLGAALQLAQATNASVDLAILTARSAAAALDAAVQAGASLTAGLSAYIQAGTTVATALDVAILQARTASASLNAAIATTQAASTSLSAAVAVNTLLTSALDAAILGRGAAAASLGAYVFDPTELVFTSEGTQRLGAKRGSGGQRIGAPRA